ncbi:hypothetical protein [Thalassospira sp. ER-Se-21-Dark]|uniref:hypothetical protein n=1 Tax=Thalassospira sp. ER-Se-21-Dark TaxID=2585190 RepID=UPI001B31188B|nr:hypothetical protein [Thalassospira sp. ER-Se-21-Dark]MBP3127649.1 hypothetical protein [Thalassospira sp. ER-Se-21-Dark]
MLSPLEIYGLIKDGTGAAVSGVRFWKRKRRILSPEEKIALRARWKSEFEEHLYVRQARGLRKDVIVRDVKRIDIYPDIPKTKGISPCFRVGLVGTYERGAMIGLGWARIIEEKGRWRELDLPYDSDEHEKVMLTGFVPYENIEHVDWDGDQYYSYPHIFCHFVYKGEPYEKVAYCRCYEFNNNEHFSELVNYKDVKRK